MGRYGSLWGAMDPYGALWVPVGALWGAMGLYGSLWVPVGRYGALWVCVAPQITVLSAMTEEAAVAIKAMAK